MIVRCSNCNSAFAVDDSKVDNKKFAFTCPKCTTENIIDNRVIEAVEKPAAAADTGGAIDSGTSFFEETPGETTTAPETAAELTSGTATADASLPPESGVATDTMETGTIESDEFSADIPLDDMELTHEIPETPAMEALPGEDISGDLDLEADLGESIPDDLDLGTGPAETPAPAAEIPSADAEMDLEIDLEGGIDLEAPAGAPEAEPETSADEFGLDIAAEEAPAEPEDIEIDIDGLEGGLDLEVETPSVDSALEEPPEISTAGAGEELELPGEGIPAADEGEIEIDLEGLDEEINLEGDLSAEEIPPAAEGGDLDLDIGDLEEEIDLSGGIEETPEIPGDLDISLDEPMETMDIPSAEPGLSEPGDDIKQTLMGAEDIPPEDEETLDLSIEDMDISLDEMEAAVSEAAAEDDLSTEFEPVEEDVSSEISLEDEIITEEVYSREETEEEEDESITIDLDSLDIELEEGEEEISAGEIPPDDMEIAAAPVSPEATPEDEDITLDLETLDIDIAEEETILPGESPDEIDIDLPELSPEKIQEVEEEEDESITLDLDTLDIDIAETSEFADGEIPEEDEKLTLEDAGLTIDELTAEELEIATTAAEEMDFEEEEDIRLSIDEIDPNLKHELENELQEAEGILSEKDDDLPEIDFDEYDTGITAGAGVAAAGGVSRIADSAIDLDESLEKMEEAEEIERVTDSVKNGSVSFSIDYSLKYSRLGALARLFLVFMLGMIPHFIVLLIYSVLSAILGFINHIVVLATKNSVEDFSEIIENTIRYSLAMNTSLIGIVEEFPIFAGKKDIDYAMQMNIIYPLAYSRLLAALRLSGIGIFLMTLPHILVLSIIGVAIPVFWLTGIISVLITGRWPHFLFDILMKYYRYMARTMAFMTGLVDKYPPFTF